MKVIALTGGIGSGKSVVASMFEQLDVPIYYADQRAKELMTTEPGLREGLRTLFGEEAFTGNALNRSYIASIVFEEPSKLASLNALVHPQVEKDFRSWLAGQKAPYVIQEIPLRFENEKESEYDAVITVTAPIETRIRRVMERDGVTRKQVQHGMDNQLPEEIKVKKATLVIDNIHLDRTRLQVKEIHRKLLMEFP